MIAALARPPLARLLRTRRAQIAVVGWATVALAFAVTARWGGSSHAADHVLLDVYGPLVAPLLAYALVGAVVGPRSLSSSAAPLVAFGAAPERAAALTLIVATVACTVAGGLLAGVVDVLAHGSANSPLARDVIATSYAAGLGGAAYAAWFGLGASFGKHGGGRLLFLVIDWALGANDGVAALATPRGHLRNLLGGVPPMDLSERASAAALVALAIGWALAALWRVR